MIPRGARTLLLAVTAACAALALSGPAASAATPPCATSQLVVWLPNGNGNGAAGSVYYKLRITNLGAACTLTGFPRVSAVNLRNHPIGKPAAREGGQQAAAVKLARGASASFQLRVVQPGDFSPADCHPVTAAGLRVAPAAGGGAKLVPFPFETCAKPTQPVLAVGPVRS